MPLAPHTRLGPYEIISALGAGGMGEVYLARDTRLAREVAIKVLPADVVADADRLDRFEREARAVSALNHPNIVTLYETGASESGPYLVLERIEGQSLRELIATGPVGVRQLLAIGAQVAAGLAKAHAAGIVHRDLKPENVMVTDDGFAKILDFGLARLVLPEGAAGELDTTTFAQHTKSGVVLGTLGYLSPEQAAGKPADFRSDQFALGALLYEMATGERPFKRETVLESLAATVRDDLPPVRSKRPDLPVQLEWITDRCLAKQPDDRYASTRDLARDLADLRDRLSEVLRGIDVPAAPAASQTRRMLPWIAGLIALVSLAVAAGALVWPRASQVEPPTYRPLTFRRGLITGARFSPDGKTIFYSMTDGAGPSRVFVTRLDGTDSRQLDLPPAILLSVSSRNELLVLLTEGRNVGTSRGTLVRVPAIGGTPRPLIESPTYGDWAPDGERLAVVRDRLLEFPLGTRLNVPAFWARVAPAGDRIAVSTGTVLTVVDQQGQTMLSHRVFHYGIAWAPDGREVWYTASPTGSLTDRALYALSLTGETRLVARSPGALTVYDVAPDGRGALVMTGAGWISIHAGTVGAAGEATLDLLGRSTLMGLSDDGKQVLIDEIREVGPGAYLRSTDGRETIRLGPDRALALSRDGAGALVSDRIKTAQVRLLPTGAGQAHDVPLPEGFSVVPALVRWSIDGRRLFAALQSASEPGVRIWVRDGDQPWRPVTPALPGQIDLVPEMFAVSADGRRVAARDASGVVTLFPVDNGAPERLDGERGRPILWDADGALFLRDDELPARIYRRDLQSGRVDPWLTIAPADMNGAVAIGNVFLSQDARTYVYQYLRGLNDLYLAQGLR